jgi:hypothetical protein
MPAKRPEIRKMIPLMFLLAAGLSVVTIALMLRLFSAETGGQDAYAGVWGLWSNVDGTTKNYLVVEKLGDAYLVLFMSYDNLKTSKRGKGKQVGKELKVSFPGTDSAYFLSVSGKVELRVRMEKTAPAELSEDLSFVYYRVDSRELGH